MCARPFDFNLLVPAGAYRNHVTFHELGPGLVARRLYRCPPNRVSSITPAKCCAQALVQTLFVTIALREAALAILEREISAGWRLRRVRLSLVLLCAAGTVLASKAQTQ